MAAKRKFTWLDAVCVALALALIAGGVWYFKGRPAKNAGQEKDYLITLRFDQTTTDPYDFYQVGDTLYFYTRSKPVGTITALRSMDLVTEEFDPVSGSYRKVIDQQWKQIEMTVAARGVLNGGSFTVNGDPLHIGLKFYPQSGTTRSTMVVWDIEEVQT